MTMMLQADIPKFIAFCKHEFKEAEIPNPSRSPNPAMKFIDVHCYLKRFFHWFAMCTPTKVHASVSYVRIIKASSY